MLITEGLDVNQVKTNWAQQSSFAKKRLLYWLALRKDSKSIDRLLSGSKTEHRSSDAPDDELSLAIILEDRPTIKVLLRYGFDPYGKDAVGAKPISYASESLKRWILSENASAAN
jgi:hypothetical protein